jgi:hypothetical protein
MRKYGLKLIITTLVLGHLVTANAQQPPAAVSILPQAPSTTETQEATVDLESDRYEKRIQIPRRAPPPEKPVVAPTKVAAPSPEISRPMEQATTLSGLAPQQQKLPEKQSVGEEFRDMVIGGSTEDIERYQNFLAPDDIRRNNVELEIAPGYVYNESASQYWPRSYNSATPSGRLGLNVWFTPFFGVNTSFTKTFLGTAQKQFNSTSQTPSMDQWLTIGLRFRRFSSSSQMASGLTLGLDYYDYQRKLPADDLYRNRLSTSAVLLSAESRVPTSETVAWLFKLEYMPVMIHREEALGRDVKSGTSPQSFGAGVSIGPEFKMNRGNRLFMRGRLNYERDSFSGTASTANPGTGEIPENVTVSNTFLFFEMGYIWGN